MFIDNLMMRWYCIHLRLHGLLRLVNCRCALFIRLSEEWMFEKIFVVTCVCEVIVNYGIIWKDYCWRFTFVIIILKNMLFNLFLYRSNSFLKLMLINWKSFSCSLIDISIKIWLAYWDHCVILLLNHLCPVELFFI
jgi:hypothetical protein